MANILEVVGKATKFSLHYDDDFFDRLSHRYTLGVLLVCMLIIGSKQYVGDVINCWTPSHFSAAHVKFTESICWISNTYYVAYGRNPEDIPLTISARQNREVTYYQWLPFILLSMACLFYMPHIVWRLMNKRSVLDVADVMDVAVNSSYGNVDQREKLAKYLVRHLDCLFTTESKFRHGRRLVIIYIAVKVVYIINCIAQFFIMNAFLQQDFTFFGVEIISQVLNGTQWKESKRFPRVTFCDFKIRRLGGLVNSHRYTIQCVLPMNLFSEKIFIFVWFWLALVAILSCWGLLPWLATLCYKARRRYVLDLLKKRTENKVLKKAFLNHYLQLDGVFILRLLGKNVNDLVATDVVLGLWDHFVKFHSSRFRNEII